MPRKWVGNTGAIKPVLRIGISQSPMHGKDCVQEQAKQIGGFCQKPSPNFSLYLSDHLCVRRWFMNQSLALDKLGFPWSRGVKHMSFVDGYFKKKKKMMSVRKKWEMGTGQATHSTHELRSLDLSWLCTHSTASSFTCLRFLDSSMDPMTVAPQLPRPI